MPSPPRAVALSQGHAKIPGKGHGVRPGGAVISGQFKLIEDFETGAVELYDLVADEGERNDLSSAQPALADSLRRMLQTWRTDVDAVMPTPNPDWTGE